jgi:hypothetical protein
MYGPNDWGLKSFLKSSLNVATSFDEVALWAIIPPASSAQANRTAKNERRHDSQFEPSTIFGMRDGGT